jgi:predicted HicB family RNase H-like nuclease
VVITIGESNTAQPGACPPGGIGSGCIDSICFHGETLAEWRREFAVAVDDYLRDCNEQGLAPEKPVSGRLLLRVPPKVHGSALVVVHPPGQSPRRLT